MPSGPLLHTSTRAECPLPSYTGPAGRRCRGDGPGLPRGAGEEGWAAQSLASNAPSSVLESDSLFKSDPSVRHAAKPRGRTPQASCPPRRPLFREPSPQTTREPLGHTGVDAVPVATFWMCNKGELGIFIWSNVQKFPMVFLKDM